MPHMKRQLGLRNDAGQMRAGFVMFLILLFARDLDVTDVTRFLRPEVVSVPPHRHMCDELKEGRAMTTKEINQRRDARVAHDLVSAASLDRDLMKRIVAIRNLVCGRIVFTTSFGVEHQAIAHAIFEQAHEIDVVTLDTGRLLPQTYDSARSSCGAIAPTTASVT